MTLKIYYLALNLICLIMLIAIARIAINGSPSNDSGRRSIVTLLVGLAAWQMYVFALANTGYLQNLSFPQPFVILTILPLFLFTAIFLLKSKKKAWIGVIPAYALILFQTFRIGIESLFMMTADSGLLHPNVTLHGYNYDMIFAFTAPIMGLLLFMNYERFRIVALIWNYVGLLVIASIIILFQTTILTPEIYGYTMKFPAEFFTYPYTLVPSFMMPAAVFVHILCIMVLNRRRSVQPAD